MLLGVRVVLLCFIEGILFLFLVRSRCYFCIDKLCVILVVCCCFLNRVINFNIFRFEMLMINCGMIYLIIRIIGFGIKFF